MSVLIEINGASTAGTKNTGFSREYLEGATVNYALTKGSFSFDNKDDAKNLAKWKEAIKNKDVVPFFSVEANLENSNTEPTYYEGRTVKIKTKAARKGKKFTHHLGIDSHSSLKSYEDSEYNRVIEFTEDGYIKAVIDSDGRVRGQKLNRLDVGIRKDATFETPASTDVEFSYDSFKEFENNGYIFEPSFDTDDIEGIYNIVLEITGATGNSIGFKAYEKSEMTPIENLALEDIIVLDADGLPQTAAGLTFTKGAYILNGTSFVTGTLSTVVVEKTNIMYEAEEASFKITVTT